MKKTKIICTVGPASLSQNTLEKMYRAGMNGARINTAYGTLDQYRVMISNLREVADIPIIIDVKGPEIRLKAKGKRTVNKGEAIEVGKDEKISFNNNIYGDVDVAITFLSTMVD